jgi:excisionase family DNA binding protein
MNYRRIPGTEKTEMPQEVTDNSGRRTLTVEEAGRALGLSRASAYAHVRAGTIPVVRLGRRLLVPKAALERLLDVEPVTNPVT